MSRCAPVYQVISMTAARVDFEMRGMVATHEAIHSLKAGDKLGLQSPANSVGEQPSSHCLMVRCPEA